MAVTLTQLAANLAKSNLAANLSSGGTTLSVTPGTGALFPVVGANQFFALTLKTAVTGTFVEVVYVTAVSGDTFTVIRGQEGTSARAWVTGDQANNQLTAGSFSNLVQPPALQQQPGNYAVSTGNNSIVATFSTVPAALTAGLTLRVKKNGNTNTGAATLNPNGLGAVAIVHNDLSATIAGDLPANGTFTVVYDGANFVLQGASAGISATQLQQQSGNYGPDSSATANALVVALSPAPANLAAIQDAPIRILKSSTANTGTCSLALNGFAVTPIVWGDGSPMGVGDLPANSLFTVSYDGINFVMQSVPFVPPMFADIQAQTGNYVADTGSGSNIYVVTLNPALLAPVIGMPIRTRIAHSNTGASTLNVNGLGAVAIHDSLGNALKANALRAGMIAEFYYDGTVYQLAVPAFVGTISANGDYILPGGLWLQWGTVTFSPSGGTAFFNVSFNFPVAFPTNCFVCVATGQDKFDAGNPLTSGSQDIVIVYSTTTTGATARIDNNATNVLSGSHAFSYFAIGN